MVKKFFKTSNLKTYYPNSELEGPIFAYGRMGCLDENTEIFIFDKEIKKEKLKDLPNKFKVVSYNFEKQKQQLQKAIKLDSGEKQCYLIELENGEKVIATEDHVFFTENNQEIKVKNLKKGNTILCMNKLSRFPNSYRPDMEGEKNPSYKVKIKVKQNGMKGKKVSEFTKKYWKSIKRAEGDKNSMHNSASKEKHAKSAIKVGKMFKKNKTFAGKNNPMFGKISYRKAIFDKELGHIVRSSWERNVCRMLKQKDVSYEYESEAFSIKVKGKDYTYTPDIKIGPFYFEVKGPIFDLQIEKMKEFNKKYPLILITSKKNIKKLKDFDCFDYDRFIQGEINVINTI